MAELGWFPLSGCVALRVDSGVLVASAKSRKILYAKLDDT